MSCELTPKIVTRTYPAQAPEVQACDYLPEWKACECCPNGFEGYDNTDGPYTYCLNGLSMITTSLTDYKNCDNPLVGSRKTVPTWSVITLTQWMATKQDQLTGSDGNPLPAGTCVPTCAELAAVDTKAANAQSAADAAQLAANNADAGLTTKQDTMTKCGGGAISGPVVQCDQLSTEDFAIGAAGNIGINFPAAPVYTKCGGGVVDNSLVQCNQLSTVDFTIGAAGNIAITECRNIPLSSDECGALFQVRAVECDEGGVFKLVRVTTESRSIANTSYQGATNQWPTDVTDHDTFISVNELTALPLAAADQTRLDLGFLAEMDFTIVCPGTYTVMIDGVDVDYGGPSGEASILPLLDNAYLSGTATPITTQRFTAHETAFSNVTFDLALTAGAHNLKFYLVGADPSGNAVSVNRIANTSRFRLIKADS